MKPYRETNWNKVAALAGVAAAVVAFLAYTVPTSPPTPQPSPTPDNSWGSGPTPTGSDDFGPTGPAIAQPSAPPAGCQQAIAAINTYNQDAGSTSGSEANAAERAANEIEAANVADQTGGYNGTIAADLNNLSNDFERLIEDSLGGGGSDYGAAVVQTNVDARQLEKDCKTG